MRYIIIFLLMCCMVQPAFAYNANHVLTLEDPVEVVEVIAYWDGGTLGFILEDANGVQIKGCLDKEGETKTPDRIYLNVTHGRQDGAFLIDKGSEIEKRINDILKKWLERHCDRTELEILEKGGRLDWEGGGNDKKNRIWKIVQELEGREE